MSKIVVGISGGVDSAVAAYLLKEQGHEVIGIFMVNWEEKDGACTSEEDYEDVKRVCNKIGIPYYTVNYSKEYYDNVFAHFLEEYQKGRTPNPDVLCNSQIKFGPFLEQAKKLGADYIATGHYCRRLEKDGKVYLAKPKDLNKDQTYFLNQLSYNQISSVIFPLENLLKSEVRQIAEKQEFSNSKKKDSTGICFIGERNFRNFLKSYLPTKPGKIIDVKGNILGEHEGLMYYTLGQRRGLNIGGRKDGNGQRYYVVDKDLKNNQLIVSQGEGIELLSKGLITEKFNFITERPNELEFDCLAKFRYRQPDQEVKVTLRGDYAKIDFKERQRAVTPGQYAVLYDYNGICLGGGVIKDTY